MEGFLAFIFGYVATSFLESFYHENLQHSSLRTLWGRFYNRWKPAARFAHTIIHHRKTFGRSYVSQFMDENEKEQVTHYIWSEMPKVWYSFPIWYT